MNNELLAFVKEMNGCLTRDEVIKYFNAKDFDDLEDQSLIYNDGSFVYISQDGVNVRAGGRL